MTGAAVASGVAVERLDVAAFTVSTEWPESDGTLAWHETTSVVFEILGAGATGLGDLSWRG